MIEDEICFNCREKWRTGRDSKYSLYITDCNNMADFCSTKCLFSYLLGHARVRLGKKDFMTLLEWELKSMEREPEIFDKE